MSQDKGVGDWYLFKEHSILRIYDSETNSYLLPTFLTLRMCVLEFIRHKFDSNYIHFSSTNQPITFKLPKKIGPLMVKRGTPKSIVEDILRDLNL